MTKDLLEEACGEFIEDHKTWFRKLYHDYGQDGKKEEEGGEEKEEAPKLVPILKNKVDYMEEE